jgi:hypothetical protein
LITLVKAFHWRENILMKGKLKQTHQFECKGGNLHFLNLQAEMALGQVKPVAVMVVTQETGHVDALAPATGGASPLQGRGLLSRFNLQLAAW